MHHSRTSSRGWQTDVHIGLYGLLQSRAPLFRPRPATWGGGTPALAAHLGAIVLADGTPAAYGTQERTALEERAVAGLMAHFQGHLYGLRLRGGAGSADSRVLLHFDETPAAEEAQIQACDEQHITIPGDDSQAALHIPVHMSQGQLISPFLCQLTVHGLPPSLARHGIGHQLLSRAGYSSQECTVEGEFMGDLPTQYASQQAAAGVGNADACLIFIRPPPGDQELTRMPRSFCIGDERVHISRPGQRGLSTPHTQPAIADSQVVTHREGPRSIRIRQREQRAARQTAAAAAEPTVAAPTAGTGYPGQSRSDLASQAPPGPGRRGLGPSSRTRAHEPGCSRTPERCPGPVCREAGTGPTRSPELQALEATVANSRQSSTDRRGLGSEPSRHPASAQRTRFIQALSAAQPQDMDCSPPIGATVLPPLRQPDSMDTDDPEPQAVPSGARPMEVLAPPQLTEDVRDELMHWMDAHTALSIPQRDDALARLYAAKPQDFSVLPLPQHLYAALQAIDEAETQRQRDVRRSQAPQIRRGSPAPTIPPGFAARVTARSAVAAAMTGIRRSGRVSTPPTAWWTTSQPQSSGRSASSRRPGQP